MKRILALAILILMGFTLVGCETETDRIMKQHEQTMKEWHDGQAHRDKLIEDANRLLHGK